MTCASMTGQTGDSVWMSTGLNAWNDSTSAVCSSCAVAGRGIRVSCGVRRPARDGQARHRLRRLAIAVPASTVGFEMVLLAEPPESVQWLLVLRVMHLHVGRLTDLARLRGDVAELDGQACELPGALLARKGRLLASLAQ